MGGEGTLDWTCKECEAHRFHCCECGAETLGEADDEMCQTCFRDLVPLDGVIRSVRSALPEGEDRNKVLAALRRDFPKRVRES